MERRCPYCGRFVEKDADGYYAWKRSVELGCFCSESCHAKYESDTGRNRQGHRDKPEAQTT